MRPRVALVLLRAFALTAVASCASLGGLTGGGDGGPPDATGHPDGGAPDASRRETGRKLDAASKDAPSFHDVETHDRCV